MSKALIVYDSVFGNTKLVAQSIADAMPTQLDALMLAVGDVEPVHLEGLSLLIVGSPTRQFRATPASMAWIKSITPNSLEGVGVAAFDTRIPEEQLKSNKILKLLSRLIAYAADPISKNLAEKGARIISTPMGFYVADTEGPLVDGELERAAEWAKSLISDEGLAQ